jgi:hypothetical protein
LEIFRWEPFIGVIFIGFTAKYFVAEHFLKKIFMSIQNLDNIQL